MSIITLTSDYGRLDYRVASIKGTILSLKSDVHLIDISHEIQAYNLLQTAYIVRNSYASFPKGTVHIISVDSFHHKDRKSIVCKVDGHYFIASDNGVLSLIFHDIKPESIYEITLNNRFDDEVSFTSTDVFVPVAVHLKNGGLPEVIGRELKSIKEIIFPKPGYNEAQNILVGEVIYIDNFGNAISNIDRMFFEKIASLYENFEVKFRNITLSKIHQQYTDIVTDWSQEVQYHGKAAAIFNHAQLLEITIYKGNLQNGASSLIGLRGGEKIFVEFKS